MSLEQAQEQLQNALVTTFLANLNFLNEYDNKLYHRVDELSRMIEDGTYKEKYRLEFIQEEGDFDVYDMVNSKYLYDKKPKRVNNKLIQDVEFDLKNSLLLLESVYKQKHKIGIEQNKKYDIQSIDEANILTHNDITSYTRLFKNKLNDDKKRLKKIKKFIFFGTLLGRHIPKIDKKIDADIYLVCEKNLELFRLSLFTVDYSVLAKNKGVIFTIMDDKFSQEESISEFLSAYIWDNYILKFSSTKINVKEYIDDVLKIGIAQRPFSYDYNRLIYTFLNRTTRRLNSSYKTLLLNKIKENMKFFDSKPVLFLAGGPSLNKNLNWIKENQDKFFIATIGATYKTLFANSIKVDLVFSLDENKMLNELQFDNENVKLLKDTIVVASNITNEQVLQKFNQEKLFLYEVFLPFILNNVVLDGFSVGEISVDILLNFGVKKLYLLGLDMALDSKTGLTHSKDSSSGINTYDLSSLDDFEKSRTNFGLRAGVMEVKGNFMEKVPTTVLFSSSILILNKIFRNINEDVKIYNLSQSGVYFENTIPKKIEDLNINSFFDIKVEDKLFLQELKNYSTNDLSKEDKENLGEKLEFLENFTQNEFEIYKEKKNITYEEFYFSTLELIETICKSEIKVVSEIFLRFKQIILSYLSFQFNNKKQKNEAKKLKEVKEVFDIQLENILKDSLIFLKRLVK